MSTRRRIEEARTRDEKALQLWEERTKEWQRTAKSVAAKVRKPVTEVLHTTTHRWREKVEDLDLIDASVPQVMKSGNSWEMSLRGGAGGVRFVKFGSSYPYPLYCPVRNSDMLDPSHNTFMRVVAPAATVEAKAGGDHLRASEYYLSRFAEYKKHISKRFPHRMHDPAHEPLVVRGGPVPTSDEPVTEGEDGAPVQHYEFEEVPPTPAQGESTEAGPAEAPVSSTGARESVAPVSKEHDGPLLLLASSRLLFHTEPGQLGQSSLRVNNMGTTAIFYSWKRVQEEPIRDSAGAPLPRAPGTPESAFALSDSTSGVLLPSDEHYFTFSFRCDSPSVMTEEWELQTVPAGAERIVIALRGVVVARESDPVSVEYITRHLDEKVRENMMSTFFTELLNRGPLHNVFDCSDEQAEDRRQREAEQNSQREEAARRAKATRDFVRQNDSAVRLDADDKWKSRSDFPSDEAWEGAARPLQLHFNEALYGKLLKLHRNAHLLVSALEGKQDAQPPTWSGSAGIVVELLQSVSDRHARRQLQLASEALIGAGGHDHTAARPEYEQLQQQWERLLEQQGNVLPLLLYSTTHRALRSAAVEMHDRATALQESLGLVDAPARKDPRGKAAKAPPKKAAKQEDEPSPEEVKETFRRRLEDEMKGVLGDMIEQSLTLWQHKVDVLDAVVDGDPLVTFADAIEARERQRAEAAAAAAQAAPAE